MEAVIHELNPQRNTELLEEIARLEKKIFPKHESLSRSLHQHLKTKNTCLLYAKPETQAPGSGEIVGYIIFSFTSSLCASITKLAVKESYRRQGYGEALLKAAIQKCRVRTVQRVCLHVDPERTPALSLYKKLGFQIDHLVVSYYSVDRNAYRMYLDFDC